MISWRISFYRGPILSYLHIKDTACIGYIDNLIQAVFFIYYNVSTGLRFLRLTSIIGAECVRAPAET